jgi:hypothetical protein
MKFECLNILEIDKGSEFMASLPNHQLLWHGTGLSNVVSIIKKGLSLTPGTVLKSGSMFGNGLYFANCSTKSLQYVRPNGAGEGVLFLCEVALGVPWSCAKATSIRSPLTESDIYTRSITNSILEYLATGAKSSKELMDELMIDDIDKILYMLTTSDIISYSAGKYTIKAVILPAHCHSVLGLGHSHPNPDDYATIDDIIVPKGRLIKRNSTEKLALHYDEYIVYNQDQVRLKYAIIIKTKRELAP